MSLRFPSCSSFLYDTKMVPAELWILLCVQRAFLEKHQRNGVKNSASQNINNLLTTDHVSKPESFYLRQCFLKKVILKLQMLTEITVRNLGKYDAIFS